MYLRTSVDDFPGYGISPAAVKGAVELGAAALTFGRDLFTGGSFSTQSSVVNYQHQNTPLDKKFVPCKRKFRISAAKPSFLPLNFVKQKDLGEKFWFELSYEYNGNDLRNVAVEPLVHRSSTLHKSEFKITFTGNAYSPEHDPVAKVVFRINGTWKAWDPLPFMDTVVSFSGNLYVRADGSARVEAFKSEKDLVWYGTMTNSCTVIAPYIPKAPVRKHYSLRPPILFPLKKAEVSDNDARRIYEWKDSWPSTTRDKVRRGEIKVNVDGFASRPGKGLYNLRLSKRRATNVARILRGATGSDAISVAWSGEYKQNLPGLFDVIQWLKRFFDPNKYDQAAVIWFEDVE